MKDIYVTLWSMINLVIKSNMDKIDLNDSDIREYLFKDILINRSIQGNYCLKYGNIVNQLS